MATAHMITTPTTPVGISVRSWLPYQGEQVYSEPDAVRTIEESHHFEGDSNNSDEESEVYVAENADESIEANLGGDQVGDSSYDSEDNAEGGFAQDDVQDVAERQDDPDNPNAKDFSSMKGLWEFYKSKGRPLKIAYCE